MTSLIPSNTIFSMLVTASLGDISTDEQNSLWEQFLQQNGIDPSTVNLANITTANAEILTPQQLQIAMEFAQFIQQTYISTQETTSQLSPNDAAKRLLIAEVYQLLIQTMQHMTYTAQVLGNNVTYLQNYRDQYAHMEGRVANNFYIANSNTGSVIPSGGVNTVAKLNNWTLGYARVTMAEYLAASVAGTEINPQGVSYEGTNQQEDIFTSTQYPLLNLYSDNVQLQTPTGLQNLGVPAEISFLGSATGVTATVFIPKVTYDITSGTYSVVTDSSGKPEMDTSLNFSYTYTAEDNTIAKKTTAVQQAFVNWLNTPISNPPAAIINFSNPTDTTPASALENPNFPFHITWNAEYNLPPNANADQYASIEQGGSQGERAQKNTLLQQYIQNTQSRMQILSNTADSENSSIQQIQTGLSSMANVLQATISNLSTMLTSIFQTAT